jgi:RNase P/RNase MRP subunit p30
VDLHVIPRVEDEKSCKELAQMLRLAGYSTIGLTLPTGLFQGRVASLRHVFLEAGLETALRVDLTPNSRTDLLRLLRRFRNTYDIIAVKCTNPVVSTVACRDRRVDVVFFDPNNIKARFNHSLASLLRGALEFNLVSSLLKESRTEVISRISKEVGIARRHRTNIVLSSGCHLSEWVRSPLQIGALAVAVGTASQQAIDGVATVPMSIITHNLERRSRQYVEEGVKVLLPRAR